MYNLFFTFWGQSRGVDQLWIKIMYIILYFCFSSAK